MNVHCRSHITGKGSTQCAIQVYEHGVCRSISRVREPEEREGPQWNWRRRSLERAIREVLFIRADLWIKGDPVSGGVTTRRVASRSPISFVLRRWHFHASRSGAWEIDFLGKVSGDPSEGYGSDTRYGPEGRHVMKIGLIIKWKNIGVQHLQLTLHVLFSCGGRRIVGRDTENGTGLFVLSGSSGWKVDNIYIEKTRALGAY